MATATLALSILLVLLLPILHRILLGEPGVLLGLLRSDLG